MSKSTVLCTIGIVGFSLLGHLACSSSDAAPSGATNGGTAGISGNAGASQGGTNATGGTHSSGGGGGNSSGGTSGTAGASGNGGTHSSAGASGEAGALGEAGASGAAGSSGSEALDCPTYCAALATNCTGMNAQFGGTDAADVTAHCLATCAAFPVGSSSDTSGNTLGCRLTHVNQVEQSNVATECAASGPLGGAIGSSGVCGSPCENFCASEIAACGLKIATSEYSSLANCMTACANFEQTHPYTITAGGDSLACRAYAVTLAATSPTTQCPHTQSSANGPCSGTATP